MREYKIGNKILITRGAFEGKSGTIQNITGHLFVIQLDDEMTTEFNSFYSYDEITMNLIENRDNLIDQILNNDYSRRC